MVSWCFIFALVAAAAASEPPAKKTRVAKAADAVGSNTDFFPHYSGFPSFPVHSQALPPQDLTALQQTHVLGDFQHRFQPQRFGPPQFQNQPLLFSQQTEFGPPQQQNSFPNRPPPPPPRQEQSPPAFPQQSQFRPVQKPSIFSQSNQFPDARPSFGDQRNQFSEPPRESQQNFAPASQQSPFSNQPNSAFSEPSIRQQQTFRQPQQINNPPPSFQNQNFQTQQFQDQAIRGPSSSFNDDNLRNPPRSNQFFPSRNQPASFFEQPLRNQPQNGNNQFSEPLRNLPQNGNNQFSEQPLRNQPQIGNNHFNDQPIRNQPQIENNQFSEQLLRNQPQNGNNIFTDQRNPVFTQPPRTQEINSQFISQPPSPRIPQENFQNNPPPPPPPPVLQQPYPQPAPTQFQTGPQNSPPQFATNQFQPRPPFQQSQQTPFNQPNFQLPLNNPNSQNFQQSFPPAKAENPVSFNPNRKPAFLPTQPPKTNDEVQYNLNTIHTQTRPQKEQDESQPPKRPLLPLLPPDLPQFNEPTTDTKELPSHKSPEQNYFPKNVQFESRPTGNEISPAPPRFEASTPASVRVKQPKPTVKEITINLGATPAPDTRKDKSSRKEKTQEEIINEQIQKLLQSHNLEIASGNDHKAETSDIPIPELPAHLKDKYQVKLVNSDTLSELKGLKKKKEKLADSVASLPPLPELPDHIKKQYDIKLVQKDELFKQFKIGEGGKLVTNADLVSPLPGNAKGGNESTQVFLANGQQLEIVRFPKSGEAKDSLAKATTIASKTVTTTTTTTTSKPPNVLFEELAKGNIPPGADFELIKHNSNGEVEKVKDLTSAKKVTFVLLEEQPDGTVKVQGVKGNSHSGKTEKDSVDSLIRKIKDGSLKLPPSQGILTNEITQASTPFHKSYVTISPFTEKQSEVYTTESYNTPARETFPSTYNPYNIETSFAFTTPATNDVPETTFVPTAPSFVAKKPKSKSRPHFLPTPDYNSPSSPRRQKTTTKRPLRRRPTTTTTTTTAQYEYEDEDYHQRSSNYNGEGPIPQDVVGQESNLQASPSLTAILQDYGLHEMAKFLDQSGLDTILNETGPYTIFIPTDAAFANLQEQLGGTDKAEDKFRENPRLLSGLLLHHVVPGSFKVSDLQDEMTGVSLAGTQLRVNSYHSEKKDAVVTINGAVVSTSKRDIPVPQGLAHAVDRVLFPLPVGDLVQTLKGDRERRFGKFVKSIEASGLEDMLTGSKTYTVFAPTDKAFAALTDAELDKLLTRREAARTIVLRHVMPGTLYSAGMHFFQVKESMERGQKITIQKELGKVKANSAQVVSANIPATNGVIHVLDTLL